MKAWYIQRYGGPEVLHSGNVDEPVMGARDVLVDIRAASINPIDWKLRVGLLKPLYKYRFPLVLGNDFSGVIAAVGQEVTRFNVGDEVYGRPSKRRIGTFAEKIAVHEEELALKPSSLNFEEAASLPLVGLTCWQAMIGVEKGQKVLIHAGAGGVGTFAIQLARHLGAEVATTASSPKHAFLRSLGATHLIDYRNTDFSKELRELDYVLDTLGGKALAKSFTCLRPGGKVVSVAGPIDNQTVRDHRFGPHFHLVAFLLGFPIRLRALSKRCSYRFLLMKASRNQLEAIAELVDRGMIRPVLDKVFPFEKGDEALAYAERGDVTGKVIISHQV